MLKRKSMLFQCFVLFLIILTQAAFTSIPAPNTVSSAKPGTIALAHVKMLAGQRVSGTIGEIKAKEYISNEFRRIGYVTNIQDFTFKQKGKTYSSSNVIAVKKGVSDKQVIVGGHYDSVSVGSGVDDNASGIGVILEVAEALKEVDTPYTIKFVAFGSEEPGLMGSSYYASQMTDAEIQNTVGMINLDSLAVGDKMYVYGGLGSSGWIREQALSIAEKNKLNLGTNPGLNPDYPVGTTGLWSDHAAFVKKGIPYAYFESTNWELGELDGYVQTVNDGEIWHTAKDTLEYIQTNYPGRIEEHLSTFTQVLTELLKFMGKTSTSK